MAQVSIIVPIYNVSDYLRECLDSVEKQTFDDIEVILVNDGSTDNSRDIALEYCDRNPRFRLIDRENGGLSAARNTGLDHAVGEYVYFLDSDDFLANDAIEILLTKSKSENLDLLKFAAYSFEDGTKDYVWSRNSRLGGYKYLGDYPDVYTGMNFYKKIIENNDFYQSCCLIFTRRSVIETNKLRFYEGILYEDNVFSFELTVLSDRVAVLNEPLYYRRIRSGSITKSSSWIKGIRAMCISAEETDRFIEEHPQIKGDVSDWQMSFFVGMMLKHIGHFTKNELFSEEAKSYYKRGRSFLDKYVNSGYIVIHYFYKTYTRYALLIILRHFVYRILRKNV